MKSQFAFKVLGKSTDTQNLLMYGTKQIIFFMRGELITNGACIPIWKWQTELLRLNLYAYKFYYSTSLLNIGVTFLIITMYSDIM
jgi:hypothetical protein